TRTVLTKDDMDWFNEGTQNRLYTKLGAHRRTVSGTEGTNFAVWAPNAQRISVIGDFNDWQPGSTELAPCGNSGIWEAFVPEIGRGARYKYRIDSRYNDFRVDKADPFGRMHEVPPATASIVWDNDYEWN